MTRRYEYLCLAAIFLLYTSADFIADSVANAVCPALFICV